MASFLQSPLYQSEKRQTDSGRFLALTLLFVMCTCLVALEVYRFSRDQRSLSEVRVLQRRLDQLESLFSRNKRRRERAGRSRRSLATLARRPSSDLSRPDLTSHEETALYGPFQYGMRGSSPSGRSLRARDDQHQMGRWEKRRPPRTGIRDSSHRTEELQQPQGSRPKLPSQSETRRSIAPDFIRRMGTISQAINSIGDGFQNFIGTQERTTATQARPTRSENSRADEVAENTAGHPAAIRSSDNVSDLRGRVYLLENMMERMYDLEKMLKGKLVLTIGHFEAVANSETHGHLSEYKGNGHVENIGPDSLHDAWRMASWMMEHDYDKQFILADGKVTALIPGLYHIYVQINYVGPNPVSGYSVRVNEVDRLRCTTSDAGGRHEHLVSTCYTAGVTYLETGDTIAIHDLEPHRIASLRPERSFFGLLKIPGTQ